MSDPNPDPTNRAHGTLAAGVDTTLEILDVLRSEGVSAQFVPGQEPKTIRCTVCGSSSAADAFETIGDRRLEGTSDPDDMVLIVAAEHADTAVKDLEAAGEAVYRLGHIYNRAAGEAQTVVA